MVIQGVLGLVPVNRIIRSFIFFEQKFSNLSLIVFLIVMGFTPRVFGQEVREPVGCGDCYVNHRTFNLVGGQTADSPTSVDGMNRNWDGGDFPGITGTAVFENLRTDGDSYYRWLTGEPGSGSGGNSTVELFGLIVETGVTLEIGRFNANETPAFDIIGGCILVKSGATLIFSYYTQMKDLRICVEDGGKIVFDSRPPGQADGDRDIFRFEDIEINLLGPDAQITFGNAEIDQLGFIVIDGYEGAGCVDNGNGFLSPPLSPPANIEVDLTRMTQAELVLFCNFLQNAGFEILPVEYLYFKSTFLAQEREVRLNWATAKEWENSHFEIERAVNGVRSWEKIGEVTGVGWSEMPVEYFFTDEQLPLTGGNIFYRLKQVDFNGDFAYSEVVSARVPSMQVTQGVWRVFPNPTNGNTFRIELLDPKRYNGEALTANLITPLAGKKPLGGNTTQAIGEEVLDLVNVHGKGVYILEITWGNRVEHIKVLKQ